MVFYRLVEITRLSHKEVYGKCALCGFELGLDSCYFCDARHEDEMDDLEQECAVVSGKNSLIDACEYQDKSNEKRVVFWVALARN